MHGVDRLLVDLDAGAGLDIVRQRPVEIVGHVVGGAVAQKLGELGVLLAVAIGGGDLVKADDQRAVWAGQGASFAGLHFEGGRDQRVGQAFAVGVAGQAAFLARIEVERGEGAAFAEFVRETVAFLDERFDPLLGLPAFADLGLDLVKGLRLRFADLVETQGEDAAVAKRLTGKTVSPPK